MEVTKSIPQCYVVVRKLTLEEISRIIISPLFISKRCARCRKFVHNGPKCTTCSKSYHIDCALQRRMCCDLPIIFQTENSPCLKCEKTVIFGPSCSICYAKFHSSCLSLYDQCCGLTICTVALERQCGKCSTPVALGPKCPVCSNMYHLECVDKKLRCCDINILCKKDTGAHKCQRCKRPVGQGCPMCQICGKVYHSSCCRQRRKCCGRSLLLEMYFIPSFNYMENFFKTFAKRRAKLEQLQAMVINHTHTLRSMGQIKQIEIETRTKKKNAKAQIDPLDNIRIVNIKTEMEELDIPYSPPPPLLERETDYSPDASSSQRVDLSMGNDESLKNLFDFLYTTVKKFPPHLQTQVKVDLFRIVTEAEMKLNCNILETSDQMGTKH